MEMIKKLVFLGNDNYGCLVLQMLLQSKLKTCQLRWLITKKDKHVKKMFLKYKALRLNTHLVKNEKESEKLIFQFKPDLILCASFGQFITKKTLQISKYEAFNFHPSLLPLYRGASPIRSAILNKEKVSGVTLFKMNKKMDAGDLYLQETFRIDSNDHFLDVFEKVLKKTNKIIKNLETDLHQLDKVVLIKQIDKEATYCSKFQDEDGYLDFKKGVDYNLLRIRALGEKPGTFIKVLDKHVIIRRASKPIDIPSHLNNYQQAQLIIDKFKLFAKAKDGFIEIEELQFENKKRMRARDFINGWRGNKILPLNSYL